MAPEDAPAAGKGGEVERYGRGTGCDAGGRAVPADRIVHNEWPDAVGRDDLRDRRRDRMSADGRSSAEPLPDVAGDSEDTRRALLDLAITAAGVGTFDWDLPTGRLGWDDRLIELFGYTPAEVSQRIEAFHARLHPEDLSRVTGLMPGAIDIGGAVASGHPRQLPDGGVRWSGGPG